MEKLTSTERKELQTYLVSKKDINGEWYVEIILCQEGEVAMVVKCTSDNNYKHPYKTFITDKCNLDYYNKYYYPQIVKAMNALGFWKEED